MAFYIQVIDGVPVNHPALEENLIDAFGSVPEGWELFVKKPSPRLTPYQYIEQDQHSYAKIDGVWTDVWAVIEFTEEQKLRRQNRVKNSFANRPYAENFASWIFNEEECQYEPPVKYPNDGKIYAWSGVDNAWKEISQAPNDGIGYEFDYSQWYWVQV